MPQSIPSGLKREHVIKALADLDNGRLHHFGESTGYVLMYEGRSYSPKAVVGVACRSLIGRILMPEEFSGGEAPGQANYVLRKLGFEVRRKDDDQKKPASGDWTGEEVMLLVADYFDMLGAELSYKPLNKSAHRRALLPRLKGRSEGSIEFKHQNLSQVLVELGLPYIAGYKPRSNYQQLLATTVEEFLTKNPRLLEEFARSPLLKDAAPDAVGNLYTTLLIEPPPDQVILPRKESKPWLSRKGLKIDFAERDAANQKLGRRGEEFVYELERRRLLQLGRDDLAKRVLWASKEIGDGLGFDILSFDSTDDSEQFLEVKTTGLGKFFPFYVTGNEVRCSEDVPQQFQLRRVFDFARDPRLYILHGSLREQCQLEPVLYRAGI